MNTVEVDRVRVRAAVYEVDPQEVVLGRADDRPRDRAVEAPGVEEHTLGNFDLVVEREEVVLADRAGLVGEGLGREQGGVLCMRATRCGHLVADHGGVADVRMVRPLVQR